MEQYRIIKALSGFYYVQTEDGVVECRARGRFRRQDQSPLVGDFVRITRQGAGKGVLEELLPRKNAFIRPAVANIDQLLVLASCAVPVTEPFLIDRVLAIAQLQSVPALVVVNMTIWPPRSRWRRSTAERASPCSSRAPRRGRGSTRCAPRLPESSRA